MEIRESQAVQYNRPNIEYEKQTVKVIIKADHKYQCEAVHTYDKHGQMRAREAKIFVEKMEAQGVPVVVQGIEGDSSTFNEYLLDNLDI